MIEIIKQTFPQKAGMQKATPCKIQGILRLSICCMLHGTSQGVIHAYVDTIQVRIQDLVRGGAPASKAESCRRSGAESRERSELSAAGVQGPLKGPGSF